MSTLFGLVFPKVTISVTLGARRDDRVLAETESKRMIYIYIYMYTRPMRFDVCGTFKDKKTAILLLQL